MSNKTIVYASIIIASILWGVATPIGKFVVENVPVAMILFFRLLISAILVGIIALVTNAEFHFKKKDLGIIVVTGLLMALTMGFFYSALEYLSATETAILYNTVPIVTIIIGAIFLRERPSLFDLTGIIIAFLGVVLIVAEPFINGDNNATYSIIGIALILFAVLSNVIYSFMGNKIPKKINITKVMFIFFMSGAIASFPLAILETVNNPGWHNNLNLSVSLGMLYIAILATLVPTLLWTYGLERITPSQVNVFVFISPVATIILAVKFLGEPINLWIILGVILTFVGIYIASRDDASHARMHKYQRNKHH
ncbi:DMT family transporter [Candidatus Dojkabacteria bacterium]|uniref:DMT family transporter n=1 Tax=Candidatus Dojkabacteria bacterium TaxID=2099670 RepID=A0A955RHU8_9BACT|nr:DMT family transporter [Candidatus Dojkabacteria bacterium]